ncbi:adenosylcobinamide amidohydrolase ['Paenibacillus yunnanensis' Narsing Rao et al. 2020]|uniref:adenosylcobinamide amidohydrolase n=1 Tax=Paenibacillus tengchongensis TaxID=2608684 RepID=UPI00124C10D9|nr:adenosylcobinamide amidohydrolase [Paenibacillus tengchongensis]
MEDVRLPFTGAKGGDVYCSSVWSGLTLVYREDHLLLEMPAEAAGISSAVYGGGMGPLKRAVNLFVHKDYDCSDPVRDLEDKLHQWGYEAEGCAGLMTAVPPSHAAVAEEDTGSAGIFCCVTAAAGNAARAGVERPVLAAYRPGTINIMLGIDGWLTPAAMVNAVMTATEAKAAALADLGIRDSETGLTATGTTTDAFVLAVSQSRRYHAEHAYAGTATDLGGAIGRLVYGAVTGSLQYISRGETGNERQKPKKRTESEETVDFGEALTAKETAEAAEETVVVESAEFAEFNKTAGAVEVAETAEAAEETVAVESAEFAEAAEDGQHLSEVARPVRGPRGQ